MATVFCSNGFEQFFELLSDEKISLHEFDVRLNKAIEYIAEEGFLGRVFVQTQIPPNVYDPEGMYYDACMYEDAQGYGEDYCREEYETAEQGLITVICYPKKGYVWSDAQRRQIHFFIQLIYLLSSRIKLLNLINRAKTSDGMTGTANLSGVMRFGIGLQSRGILEKYQCAFMNIKNFKYVNQRFGNSEGDVVLQEYCHLINEFLNEDEIIGRMGGDNFVVLFLKEREDKFLDFMKEIRVCLPNGKRVNLETRMGLYKIVDGDIMSSIMDRGTTALNIARSTKTRDWVWFEKSMQDEEERNKIVSGLFAQALQNQEFVVYYQPKVSLTDNCLCGAEALVRWNRDGKMIPPGEFIPVLEREGTICDLDFYVFEKVCQDINLWQAQGIDPVRVSVNFSKVHMFNFSFTKRVLAVLEKYHIDTHYIEIELTESSTKDSYVDLIEFIRSMRDCGINVSIDDFGTGYSSLSLLKDLEVDIIKLDKSFIDHIEKKGGTDEIVIKNIIRMVNELNLQVIAEGVETLGQASFLKNAHCSMAQGYLFDRPLPREEFESRLVRGRDYYAGAKMKYISID